MFRQEENQRMRLGEYFNEGRVKFSLQQLLNNCEIKYYVLYVCGKRRDRVGFFCLFRMEFFLSFFVFIFITKVGIFFCFF